MGKKSRRKGGGTQRRGGGRASAPGPTAVSLHPAPNDKNGIRANAPAPASARKRPFFVGDRVWFQNCGQSIRQDPYTYRGHVVSVDEAGRSLKVDPLCASLDMLDVGVDLVFPDFCNMTLRFSVGEQVLINTTEGWVHSTVDCLWPIHHVADPTAVTVGTGIPHYRCADYILHTDSDLVITKQPTLSWDVGDETMFNPKKARAIDNDVRTAKYLENSESWVLGKVTARNISRTTSGYACYECSFQVKGKTKKCHITKDNFEHIIASKMEFDIRERLFGAISADCKTQHFEWLTTFYKMDVSVVLEGLVERAIKFASFNALLWLRKCHDVDLRRLCDNLGNNFMHKIASSDNPVRFIDGLNRSCSSSGSSPHLDVHGIANMLSQVNDSGRSPLHILVQRGDVAAFDAVLSLKESLSWAFAGCCTKTNIHSLRKCVDKSKDPDMLAIIGSFQLICEGMWLYNSLYSHDSRKRDDSIFWGDRATIEAKTLVRFYRDWLGHRASHLHHGVFPRLAMNGSFRLFKLFYSVDKDWFVNLKWCPPSRLDHNEYIQPELSTFHKNHLRTNENFGIIDLCMIGDGDYPPIECKKLQNEKDKHSYFWELKDYIKPASSWVTKCSSWLEHLKEAKEKHKHFTSLIGDSAAEALFQYKITLLEDDKDLNSRLEILDLLLQDESQNCVPDIMTPIRFRQCGVLKWLVNRGLTKLNNPASEYTNLVKYEDQFHITDFQDFVRSSLLGDFLCFAAVECDDLYSLQWLHESQNFPTTLGLGTVFGGFNLLHLCAFLGRIEITAWLKTSEMWGHLAGKMSCHKMHTNAFAVHIAASQGHILLADLLLNFECVECDREGRTPQDYARKSKHKFVQKWIYKKDTPSEAEIFNSNIKQLTSLLIKNNTSSEDLKEHIIKSKCLHVKTWRAIGCYYYQDMPNSSGFSYQNVVEQCLKYHDLTFVLWLSRRLCFLMPENGLFVSFWEKRDEYNKHTKTEQNLLLSFEKMLAFSKKMRHQWLTNILSRKYAKDIVCADLAKSNLFLLLPIQGDSLAVTLADDLLLAKLLISVSLTLREQMKHLFGDGACKDEVIDLLGNFQKIRACLDGLGYFSPDLIEASWDLRFIADNRIYEMGVCLRLFSFDIIYGDNHPLRGTGFCYSRSFLSELHMVLAIEGYTELLKLCLSHFQGWNEKMELEVVYIAAFYGHSDILDIFFWCDESTSKLLSKVSERFQTASFGMVEAGHYRDFLHFTPFLGTPSDPILTEDIDSNKTKDAKGDSLAQKSLAVIAVRSIIKKTGECNVENQNCLLIIRALLEVMGYTHKDLVLAMQCALRLSTYSQDISIFVRFTKLFEMMKHQFEIEPVAHEPRLQASANIIFDFIERLREMKEPSDDEKEKVRTTLFDWINGLAMDGINVQNLAPEYLDKGLDRERLESIQTKQAQIWSTFDVVKHKSLVEVKCAVENGYLNLQGRDRGGLLLTHLAAAYDKPHILEWLVTVKHMRLKALDGYGRTPLDVARESKARLSTEWISKYIIQIFVHRNYWKTKNKKLFQSAIVIQKITRGRLARKLYLGSIILRLEESHRFTGIWANAIKQMPSSGIISPAWEKAKTDIDLKLADFSTTDQKLSVALSDAIDEDVESVLDTQAQEEKIPGAGNLVQGVASKSHESNQIEYQAAYEEAWSSIQLSHHVVKWLKHGHGDPKYKSFFVRRMRQLARGERSRILQKRLSGSQATIYETYLEQKSGFRILWTEDGNSIIVWFVAKHKLVSRYMKLIDNSKKRLACKKTADKAIIEDASTKVLLDPLGNVPLKTYDINIGDIDAISASSWTPQMHLTDEERSVVEADGTVLLLGRSGTGKTVCICNRMERDKDRFGDNSLFTQLFVSRSKRLCKYVSGVVGSNDPTLFKTFSELVNDLDLTLQNQTTLFLPSQYVGFSRFRRDFYYELQHKNNVGALVVWKTIRTFLKGSIEAYQSPGRVLSKECFINGSLGKNRCRIPADLRPFIYNVFLKYTHFINRNKLWDDCDRIIMLLAKIEESMKSNSIAFEKIRRSRIYVDEIQDYTQVECLVFFYLGGAGGLFLAGDPAQSVVEGTDFRFEEIRSVGHFVAGKDHRHLIPNKPLIVNTNFRSHAGILNTASSILDLLFEVFPNAARQLEKDHGVFNGARPEFCYTTKPQQLSDLLSDKLKGTVVICNDESASRWRHDLNYSLVYGIGEAKGLEFKSVLILDFFNDLPDQKPWRNLLLNRVDPDYNKHHPLVETQLKLLYVAVTRCIERLFLVETRSSLAGAAAVRWLTTSKKSKSSHALATSNDVMKLSVMNMTSDEFVIQGVENAQQAESLELELDQAVALLDRSIFCFDAANSELVSKARVHKRSVQFRFELTRIKTLLPVTKLNMIVEAKAAQIIEALLRENIFIECLYLTETVAPFLSSYTRREIENRISSKLRLLN